jgi:hypothetical protein
VSYIDSTTIIKNVELKSLGEKQINGKKKANNEEDYTVAALEDQRQDGGMGNNFSLFDMEDLKVVDSRKTSASTTIQGGSLATVLQQALVSEDKDQLDWIFKQRDIAIIDKTLYQIKDHKTVCNLFNQILVKYQQQEDIFAITAWLKQLMKIHWSTIVKSDQVKSLMGISQFIDAKTKNMNELMLVKGKLEMLKNTYQVQDPSQKYKKIKQNIKSLKDEDT